MRTHFSGPHFSSFSFSLPRLGISPLSHPFFGPITSFSYLPARQDVLHLTRAQYIDAASTNASMCPTPNGDGLELEKSNNHTQPPSISLTAPPTEIIDAGLKSLNHCECSDYGLTSAPIAPLDYVRYLAIGSMIAQLHISSKRPGCLKSTFTYLPISSGSR